MLKTIVPAVPSSMGGTAPAGIVIDAPLVAETFPPVELVIERELSPVIIFWFVGLMTDVPRYCSKS